MSYVLRGYQQEAVDAAINWVRKNSLPALLHLDTGAGKSLICAELSRLLKEMSGKKVLCLCPSAELVEQNAEKFSLTGEDFSIYSASISKSLRHDVIFATEGSFKSVAKEHGGRFSCVILDEAHRITPTIKKIIEDMRESNPNLRVIGMTATPYRLGTGYIYEIDQQGRKLEKIECIDPYFKKLIFSVGGDFLVAHGYLTKPVLGVTGVSGYDTSTLKLGSSGSFSQRQLDEVFVGHGRKTAEIVADVVSQAGSRGSRGVMFFAATIKHAEEVMASLPAYNSALVTGETPKKERKRIITEYKAQKIKYLVNVSVLTTGFDAPHTDLIAVLRASESASLLAQIYGRGLRLYEGKEECYILDYAGNDKNFFPDGDIFSPQIKAFGQKPAKKIEVECPVCKAINEFAARQNLEGAPISKCGYFLDMTGEFQMYGDKKFPAHFGRRCKNVVELGKNVFERCSYFWSYKECESCGHKNDIAARECDSCGKQMIDPNSKLSIEFQQFKADLTKIQTDIVKGMIKKMIRPGLYMCIFETEYRKIEVFFSDRVNSKFLDMVKSKGFKPSTVSYKKQSAESKYFIVSDFNRPEDIDKK